MQHRSRLIIPALLLVTISSLAVPAGSSPSGTQGADPAWKGAITEAALIELVTESYGALCYAIIREDNWEPDEVKEQAWLLLIYAEAGAHQGDPDLGRKAALLRGIAFRLLAAAQGKDLAKVKLEMALLETFQTLQFFEPADFAIRSLSGMAVGSGAGALSVAPSLVSQTGADEQPYQKVIPFKELMVVNHVLNKELARYTTLRGGEFSHPIAVQDIARASQKIAILYAAMAAYAPAEDAKKKVWLRFTAEGKAAALDMSRAARAESLREYKAAFSTLRAACAACHDDFRNPPPEDIILRGHKGMVSSVAFSPNNRYLASAGNDKTVRLWDAGTGELIRTREGHEGFVSWVAFSPDSTRLASASDDRTVRVWDVKTGQGVFKLQGHRSWVNSVAFSPDGQQIATAGEDEVVKLWDAATGKEELTLRGHKGAVLFVTFSPDGRYLASLSEDRTVKLWDLQEDREGHTFPAPNADLRSVAFGPDGRELAIGRSGGAVWLADVKRGKEVEKTFNPYLPGICEANFLAFSPDGKFIAGAGSTSALTLWNTETRQQSLLTTEHRRGITAVAFSPGGRRIATAGEDGTVRVQAMDRLNR